MFEFWEFMEPAIVNWTILVLLLAPDDGRLMIQIQDSPLGIPFGTLKLPFSDVMYPPHSTTKNINV
jgi:hypothetical protein